MEETDWQASPCFYCRETPCCNWVPVTTLRIDNFGDVCKAMRVLYFRNIQIGLYDTGKWMVYYRSTCRHFDPATTRCLIHTQPQRPEICGEYQASECWYKQHFQTGDGLHFIRFNLPRFLALWENVTYLPDGELDHVPEWEEILEIVTRIPLELDPRFLSLAAQLQPYGCQPHLTYPAEVPFCTHLLIPKNRQLGITRDKVNSFQTNFPGLTHREVGDKQTLQLATSCCFSSIRGCALAPDRYKKRRA